MGILTPWIALQKLERRLEAARVVAGGEGAIRHARQQRQVAAAQSLAFDHRVGVLARRQVATIQAQRPLVVRDASGGLARLTPSIAGVDEGLENLDVDGDAGIGVEPIAPIPKQDGSCPGDRVTEELVQAVDQAVQ